MKTRTEPDFMRHLSPCRDMLEFPPDWDGEGSLPYQESTWQCAVDFLLHNMRLLWERAGILVTSPEVQNGPHCSIDVYWHSQAATLLVNFPAGEGEEITFYGCRAAECGSVKGVLSMGGENDWLLLWADDDGGERIFAVD